MAEGQLVEKELEESKKRIEVLEKEKAELADKTKGLADIIENLSGQADPGAIEAAVGTHLKEFGERFDSKIRKLEEAAGGKDDVKKQVASLMKDKVDPKLGEISDKLKDLEKLKDLGDKIAQINDRLSSPLYQPKQPGAVSQGLSSFGEQIDFESELNDVRKTIDTINMSLANLSKKAEYRLSSAEDKLKELEKLKGLETQYREINDKLGLENIEKLKKLVFTADELMEQVIPETVSRKMRKRVEPIVNSLKANRDFSNELEKRLSLLDGDVRELKKFRDTINELRMEKDKLYKKFAEEEARFLQGLEILKMNIRKRMEKMMEKYHEQLAKMQEFASAKTIETSVKDVMAELVEGRLQGMEKHLMILDEKARALSEKDRDILGQVEEMEAPENLRKWIADKTKDMERKFYYDVQGFKKESEKNSEYIASMRERQKSFESGMNDFSKKMSDQVSTINKVIDLKDVFAKRAESLASEVRSLDSRIAGERERTIVLEQNLRDAESRFDKLSDNLQIVDKVASDIKPLRGRLAEAEAAMKILGKKLADKDTLAAQVRRMEADMASVRERQADLEAQLAADRTRLESILNQTVSERRQVQERIKKEKLKVGELLRELKA
jgi:DNA repair exonuclease SbcCD ATPase subunit